MPRYSCKVCGKYYDDVMPISTKIHPYICGQQCFIKYCQVRTFDMPWGTEAEHRVTRSVDYRSLYEAKLARLFKRHEIPFEYETVILRLPDKSIYVPDFYLPKTNLLIEVKGKLYPGAKKKILLFAEQYPRILLYLDKTALTRFGVL